VLHGTPQDAARKLNRPENVRPIAATDPDFARLNPRRNDAESINRSSTTHPGSAGLTALATTANT
jgi:hypothetical protein